MSCASFIAERVALESVEFDDCGKSYEELSYLGNLEINAPGFCQVNTVPEHDLLAIADQYGIAPWDADTSAA
jgi:hypothetical protein